MADVLTAEQGIIQTSIGDYYIPIVTIAEPFSSFGGNSITISLDYSIFSGIKHSYFTGAEGVNVCAPFTIGSSLSVYRNGSNYYMSWNGTSLYLNYFPLCVIPFLIRDGNGAYAVHQVSTAGANVAMPAEYNPLGFGNVQTQITEGVFGVLTCSMTGRYSLTNNRLSDSILIGSYLMNYFPIQYTWRSWERIAGNNGQFNAPLTTLKTATLSDIDAFAYKVLADSDFDSLTRESSIWNTYINALLGIEYTVAYSGLNYATLTITNHATDPGIKIFTFKFYFAATSAPFATIAEEVIVGGENPALIKWDYFISFLYDSGHEVAVFYPIEYTPNNSLIKYSHQVMSSWSDVTMGNMYTWLQGSSGAPSGSGPYDTGTTDNGGHPGGGGHQDPMPNIHVPSLSGLSSGMFTIYCPDDTELAQIADFLWSDNVLDNFKKYFNNFSDNIIALYVLPYTPANMPTKAFTVGNLTSETITSVSYVTTRFVSIDMGEITVGTRWDSYLDFEPYTKFNIYLPGIGVQALSADDIMCPPNMDESLPASEGSKIKLDYVLDLMTGNVAAYVKINGQIRYQFTGKVGYSIPVTGANYNSLVQGYVMATAGLIGTLATAGAAAPFAASAGAAGIINAMKPDVYRGGNLSGDSSSMCLDYPYLIRRRPNKPELTDQESFTGFPSYKDGLLSEFTGYTEVLQAHVEGISCTESERAEILRLLKEGVII